MFAFGFNVAGDVTCLVPEFHNLRHLKYLEGQECTDSESVILNSVYGTLLLLVEVFISCDSVLTHKPRLTDHH